MTKNISAVYRDAFISSPLYRHYLMRHLASDSAGCPSVADKVQNTAANPVPDDSVYIFTDGGQSQSLTLGSPLTTRRPRDDGFYNISRKGVRRGLLGAAGSRSCFCGFQEVTRGNNTSVVQWCSVPREIVAYFNTSQSASLQLTENVIWFKNVVINQQGGFFKMDQNFMVQRTLRQTWQAASWRCPEMDPSDHWGIIRNATAWILSKEGTSIPANDLLETGYGGLRVGTIPWVLEESRKKITPAARVGTMNPYDGGTLTGQSRCQSNNATMRPESLAGLFVDDLFPAAQGVVDSAPVSHCMRYALEVARVNVIAILTGTNTTREQIMTQQSAAARMWRQKCAAQVRLLGMCVTTKALDVKGGVLSKQPSQCPFRLAPGAVYSNSQGYITPGCLVYAYASSNLQRATLHDPCRFHACSVLVSLRIKEDLVDQPRTYVPFNPVNLVDPYEVRGVWPSVLEGNKNNQTVSDVQRYERFLASVQKWYDDMDRDLPGGIVDVSLFQRSLLDEETGTGVGSPYVFFSSSVLQAPALKSTTTTTTTRCDMMQDWYPDHFEYPLAYHPTTPCMSEDTSYRTFDRSFSMNYATNKMEYHPLSMRDMDFVHTHFGAEGLCRTTNVAMDMMVSLLAFSVCLTLSQEPWSKSRNMMLHTCSQEPYRLS